MTAPIDKQRYLSARKAAAYLDIPLQRFYRHVRPNIPAIRFGELDRFDRVDLDAYVARQKAKPNPRVRARTLADFLRVNGVQLLTLEQIRAGLPKR